jgi:hypothetical protein
VPHDDVRFALDWYAYLDLYSASAMRQ